MSEIRKLRCAVYTRKSSEDGLDQSFNSLDAQREACVAYVAWQASLGWRLVAEPYDDGGISGGTLERPGIQRLLQDIRDGKVDVVVVYKIDRLTRSLMDFAKLVEVFDKHSVSFVSVTQQFNTTTSMGRLTLNVLLSFAQFEREVTAERIRDKVAASKRKGIWMGGVVPFGYRAQDRRLIIDEASATQVRQIFQRYLQLRSVDAVVRELNGASQNREHVDRTEQTTKSSAPHSRSKIYHLLANPIYIGKIRHKGEMHDGEHAPIIDAETFEAVQRLLAEQAANARGWAVHSENHLLTGRLHDEHGHRLMPVYTTNHGKRYRCYVTNVRKAGSENADKWRIAAPTIEPIVEAQLAKLLKNRSQLSHWIEQYGNARDLLEQLQNAAKLEEHIATDRTGSLRKAIIRTVFRRITLASDWLRYDVDAARLVDVISNHTQYPDADAIAQSISKSERSRKQDANEPAGGSVEITEKINLKRRGVEMRIVIDDRPTAPAATDQTLVDMIARAHLALAALTDGSKRGIADVAQSMEMDASDLSRIFPLAFLSPKLTEAILTGRQPPDLTLRRLTRSIELPIEWASQNELLAG
jgi:site-specific DNA recombinase